MAVQSIETLRTEKELRFRDSDLWALYRTALADLEESIRTINPEGEDDAPFMFLAQSPSWPSLAIAHVVRVSDHSVNVGSAILPALPITIEDEALLNNFAGDWQETHAINEDWTLMFGQAVTGMSTKDDKRLPLTKLRQIYPLPKSSLPNPK